MQNSLHELCLFTRSRLLPGQLPEFQNCDTPEAGGWWVPVHVGHVESQAYWRPGFLEYSRRDPASGRDALRLLAKLPPDSLRGD